MLKLAFSIADALFDQEKIKEFVDSYNNKTDKVPLILKGLLGNERVNIKISLSNGSILRIGYETKNARIIRVVDGGLSNPTINVIATQNAIDRIDNSKDPIETFQKERDLGRVSIEGQNMASKIMLDAVLSSTSALRFFYNIFFA
jgi:hypothetical protein